MALTRHLLMAGMSVPGSTSLVLKTIQSQSQLLFNKNLNKLGTSIQLIDGVCDLDVLSQMEATIPPARMSLLNNNPVANLAFLVSS